MAGPKPYITYIQFTHIDKHWSDSSAAAGWQIIQIKEEVSFQNLNLQNYIFLLNIWYHLLLPVLKWKRFEFSVQYKQSVIKQVTYVYSQFP